MMERAAAQANARNHAPGRPIARDPAGTGTRGENLGLAARAGIPPLRFPLKPSGLVRKI